MPTKKCYHCKKEIEDWAFNNKDEENNEYCMDCVSKVVAVAQEGEQ